ncbi:hypothetical protein C8R43DRAFT_1242213 [Mycena crocata]|nr:hypothetical protein C8R43DRAFT_1242213 [Mycena crocata]
MMFTPQNNSFTGSIVWSRSLGSLSKRRWFDLAQFQVIAPLIFIPTSICFERVQRLLAEPEALITNLQNRAVHFIIIQPSIYFEAFNVGIHHTVILRLFLWFSWAFGHLGPLQDRRIHDVSKSRGRHEKSTKKAAGGQHLGLLRRTVFKLPLLYRPPSCGAAAQRRRIRYVSPSREQHKILGKKTAGGQRPRLTHRTVFQSPHFCTVPPSRRAAAAHTLCIAVPPVEPPEANAPLQSQFDAAVILSCTPRSRRAAAARSIPRPANMLEGSNPPRPTHLPTFSKESGPVQAPNVVLFDGHDAEPGGTDVSFVRYPGMSFSSSRVVEERRRRRVNHTMMASFPHEKCKSSFPLRNLPLRFPEVISDSRYPVDAADTTDASPLLSRFCARACASVHGGHVASIGHISARHLAPRNLRRAGVPATWTKPSVPTSSYGGIKVCAGQGQLRCSCVDAAVELRVHRLPRSTRLPRERTATATDASRSHSTERACACRHRRRPARVRA